jgi:hypothetical protein
VLVKISTEQSGGPRPAPAPDPYLAVDVLLGLTRPARRVVTWTTRGVSTLAGPPLRLSLHPPGLPESLHPARWIDALARSGVERREVLAAKAGRRLDVLVPAVVATVLDRLDLTAVVLDRVDLDRVVTTVLDRLDLTAVVLDRVDLDRVVTTALDGLDLTAVVLDRVDLDAVVTAVLAQVDLVAIAEDVIDGVDLPEIIRESTGSMASDTVRGARMQGISADEAVGRAVDRLLLRHGRRTVQPPGPRDA